MNYKNDYISEKVFNPECGKILFPKLISLYYKKGLKACEQYLISKNFQIDNYANNSINPISTLKLHPILKVEETSTDTSLIILFKDIKISLSKFKSDCLLHSVISFKNTSKTKIINYQVLIWNVNKILTDKPKTITLDFNKRNNNSNHV